MNPGKAKRIRTLDEEGFSKLVWDSNRVWSSASRRLHGAGQEMIGQNLCIVPRIAQELVPGVAVEDLQGTLDDMKRAWTDPQRMRHWGRNDQMEPETALKWRIWWVEEWHRPDSIHELLTLDAEAQAKARTLLAETGRRTLLKEGRQSLAPRTADVQILCEAAALGEKVVMTENFRSINHVGVNAWARELHRRGEFRGRRLIERPSQVLEAWCVDHPGWMLRCVMAAAWDAHGATLTAESATRGFAQRMGEQELAPLGVHALCELEVEPDIAEVANEIRATAPWKVHQAEARSPTGEIGARRNWYEDEEGVDTQPKRRWVLNVDKRWFQIVEQGIDGETIVAKIPTGDRAAIVEALVERGIEVEGLPQHHGQTGGGFAAALSATIDEELERQRSQTRSR